MSTLGRAFGLAAALVFVSACGGGGGSGGGTQPTSYTVSTSTTGTGSGSLSPASMTVSRGSTASFTISPTTGSSIAGVSGCGGSLSGNTYTTGPINSNCAVTANFSEGSNVATVLSSVQEDEVRVYRTNIPRGATQLLVELTALSQDADLEVFGPGVGEHCSSENGGTTPEACWFTNPTPGDWIIEVYGYDSGTTNYRLTATVSPSNLTLTLVESVATVFQLRNPALAQPGGSQTFNLSGASNQGDSISAVISVTRRADTVFNGQAAQQFDQFTTISFADGETSSGTTTVYQTSDGVFLGSIDHGTGVRGVPEGPQAALPASARIGQSGFLGNRSYSDGLSESINWSLEQHVGSPTLTRAQLVYWTSLQNPNGQMQQTRVIDAAGNILSVRLFIFFANGLVIDLST